MKKNQNGFTMAEMMITVAILAILAGLAFIGVVSYMKSLHQLEMDAIAKEIFVSAQNHLSMADSQGFPGMAEKASPFGHEDRNNEGTYYFIYNLDDPNSTDTIFGMMLPLGSIDETVRLGGTYIIQYQKTPAVVKGVFYASKSGRYAYTDGFSSGDYETLFAVPDSVGYRGEDRTKRRDYKGTDAILGWYGGIDLQSGRKLETPIISVDNAEKLTVTVKLTNGVQDNEIVQLIITGLNSKARIAIDLVDGYQGRCTVAGSEYTVVLDDITTAKMHFGDIEAVTANKFLLGENISVQAKLFSSEVLTNVAISELKITNSLYDTATTVASDGTTEAFISNIRHLENLSKNISGIGDVNYSSRSVDVKKAYQTDDIKWSDFINAFPSPPNGIVPISSNVDSEYFRAITPGGVLEYDGAYYSIEGITVNNTTDSDAGLFATMQDDSKVNNLNLLDFSITGTNSAGALVGSLPGTNTAITNVIARNTDNTSALASRINASSGNAGGLIGEMNGGIVQYSGAAVIVGDKDAKPTNAGGLIGKMTGGTINGCYSGGHTQNGSYNEWVKNSVHPYDVTGVTAGGLVGDSAAEIKNSYSTCSVSGSTAGGFVGNASGSIENCYATGLVSGSTAQFAFVASGSPDLSGNYYYRVINEVPSTKENAKEGETEPMPPVEGYDLNKDNMDRIKPLDLNADTYNDFVGAFGAWDTAAVYDKPTLESYYSGKYPLRTVLQLPATGEKVVSTSGIYFVSTHYGDWPAPEVFFINTGNS